MKTDNRLNNINPSVEDTFRIDPYKTLHFDLKDGKVESSYGPSDGSIASDAHQITECVKGIIRSKRDLFRLEDVKIDRRLRPPPTSRLEMTKLGECFLKCLQMDFDRVLDAYPSIGQFNRYFDLFYKAVTREIHLTNGSAPFVVVANDEWLNSGDWKVSATNRLIQYVQPLNDVVDEIRRKGNSQAFRDWIEKLERQPASNRDTLWSLVLACLNANHHLSVLRFDLGYGKHYCDPELSGGHAITYEDVRSHRRALRRFLKRDLSRMLPAGACKGMGFAIKLEFGLDKTSHFHVLVILNGDVVCQHAVIAEMICHYWNETITRGMGGSYSCFRSYYLKEGIGSIRYNDEEKLRNLEKKVVPYVTKADFYIDMVKPDGHRSFWKSQPPKIEAKRRGRKRSKTGVALPLVKPKPVADFEECLARFSNSAGEGSVSPRMDADEKENGMGGVAQSIGAVIDSGDIPWCNPVA
ncbi:hypothetical protein M3I54_07440 [Paraburkholderia sp. CNPSo 3274]|uniref:hypothetical protein n=1 Tax=Paraburkholderia sp. CNPSo 3274 TaxID=2940932 RepID=UPI0020B6833F|nr:hypothetical protein [Paraburkholderia sp. CNPSo 3274]MCP3706821.1 hypothetical protein [Paraburkholderia sp. CNPSo 3274]